MGNNSAGLPDVRALEDQADGALELALALEEFVPRIHIPAILVSYYASQYTYGPNFQ